MVEDESIKELPFKKLVLETNFGKNASESYFSQLLEQILHRKCKAVQRIFSAGAVGAKNYFAPALYITHL